MLTGISRIFISDYDSFLVHFFSLLAIRPQSYELQDATAYTPILAAFQHTIRMIVLGSVFVPSEDTQLPISQKQELAKKREHQFMELRKATLVLGCNTAFNVIQRWLRYGIAISKKTQKDEEFDWLDNMQVLLYKDQRFPVQNLPRFASELLEQTASHFRERLCFGRDLTATEEFALLKDDRYRRDKGFSFLLLPENRQIITPNPRTLWSYATSDKRNPWRHTDSMGEPIPGKWDLTQWRTYADHYSTFQENVLLLFHMLGGQAPRGAELLTLRIMNTDSMERNLYLVGSDLVYVLRYHKGQSKTRFQKKIARFLPESLKRIILVYLYHVRPFVKMIQRVLKVPVSAQSSLFWSQSEDESKPWTSDTLRLLMQRHSQRLIGFSFNIQNYRQISIIINRDILCTPTKDLDDSDNEIDEAILDDSINYHDAQAGHTSSVAKLRYGVRVGEVSGMDPSIYARYREVSKQWHNFLLGDDLSIQSSKVMKIMFLCTYVANKQEGTQQKTLRRHVTRINPATTIEKAVLAITQAEQSSSQWVNIGIFGIGPLT
jgi:hypothetical protein